MKTGLFFGSFNPIHIGHLALANYILEYSDLDQIWFVISPQNPLKQKKSLLNDYHRLEMVHRAVSEDLQFRVSDVEFKMPKPSYTIDTLVVLQEKYPEREFVLIMGEDNLVNFHKWKNAARIIEKYERYVYPRPGSKVDFSQHENVEILNAPQMEISSSMIRKAIQEGKDMRYFLPQKVWEYIDEMNFYK